MFLLAVLTGTREDIYLCRRDSGVHSNSLHYSLSTLQELGNMTKASD